MKVKKFFYFFKKVLDNHIYICYTIIVPREGTKKSSQKGDFAHFYLGAIPNGRQIAVKASNQTHVRIGQNALAIGDTDG